MAAPSRTSTSCVPRKKPVRDTLKCRRMSVALANYTATTVEVAWAGSAATLLPGGANTVTPSGAFEMYISSTGVLLTSSATTLSKLAAFSAPVLLTPVTGSGNFWIVVVDAANQVVGLFQTSSPSTPPTTTLAVVNNTPTAFTVTWALNNSNPVTLQPSPVESLVTSASISLIGGGTLTFSGTGFNGAFQISSPNPNAAAIQTVRRFPLGTYYYDIVPTLNVAALHWTYTVMFAGVQYCVNALVYNDSSQTVTIAAAPGGTEVLLWTPSAPTAPPGPPASSPAATMTVAPGAQAYLSTANGGGSAQTQFSCSAGSFLVNTTPNDSDNAVGGGIANVLYANVFGTVSSFNSNTWQIPLEIVLTNTPVTIVAQMATCNSTAKNPYWENTVEPYYQPVLVYPALGPQPTVIPQAGSSTSLVIENETTVVVKVRGAAWDKATNKAAFPGDIAGQWSATDPQAAATFAVSHKDMDDLSKSALNPPPTLLAATSSTANGVTFRYNLSVNCLYMPVGTTTAYFGNMAMYIQNVCAMPGYRDCRPVVDIAQATCAGYFNNTVGEACAAACDDNTAGLGPSGGSGSSTVVPEACQQMIETYCAGPAAIHDPACACGLLQTSDVSFEIVTGEPRQTFAGFGQAYKTITGDPLPARLEGSYAACWWPPCAGINSAMQKPSNKSLCAQNVVNCFAAINDVVTDPTSFVSQNIANACGSGNYTPVAPGAGGSSSGSLALPSPPKSGSKGLLLPAIVVGGVLLLVILVIIIVVVRVKRNGGAAKNRTAVPNTETGIEMKTAS